MALTAQQAWMTWQGTPYEAELQKYSTYNPPSPDGLSESWGWNDAASESAFQQYVRNQEQFRILQSENPSSAGLLVNYNDFKDDPAKVTGQLLRSQYDDYLSRFAPIEQQMYDMTTYRNPGLVNQEIDKAIGDNGYVNVGLENAAGQQQRGFARYGLTPNAAQRTAIDRTNALTGSTARVNAANTIRRNLAARNDLIMIGATPNSGRSYSLRTE